MCIHVYRYIFEPTDKCFQYNDILILYNSTAHNVNT